LTPEENESARVRARVVAARELAAHRFAEEPGVFANAQLGARQVRRPCRLMGSTRALLRTAAERLGLTARALDRVRKVARTIADLEGASEIGDAHLAEALQYRGFDRAALLSQE
jgi:magnesium chelatase family protein